MPKKYLVFSFWDYYPTGGWDDLICKVDTLEEAYDAIIKADLFSYQIIDATTQEYLHGGLVFQLKQGIKDEE